MAKPLADEVRMNWKPSYCLVVACVMLFASVSCAPLMMNDSVETSELVCIGDVGLFRAEESGQQDDGLIAGLIQLAGDKYVVSKIGKQGSSVLRRGEKSIWKQKPFKNLLDSSPEVIVVLLGSHDIEPQNWKYRRFFNGNYTKLVMDLKKMENKPRVFVSSIVAFSEAEGRATKVERAEEFTAQIKVIAHVTGATFIDISSSFYRNPNLFVQGHGRGEIRTKKFAEMIFEAITSSESESGRG